MIKFSFNTTIRFYLVNYLLYRKDSYNLIHMAVCRVHHQSLCWYLWSVVFIIDYWILRWSCTELFEAWIPSWKIRARNSVIRGSETLDSRLVSVWFFKDKFLSRYTSSLPLFYLIYLLTCVTLISAQLNISKYDLEFTFASNRLRRSQ